MPPRPRTPPKLNKQLEERAEPARLAERNLDFAYDDGEDRRDAGVFRR